MDDRAGSADADRPVPDRRSADPPEPRDDHPARRRGAREARAGDPRSWGDGPIARARRPAETAAMDRPQRRAGLAVHAAGPPRDAPPASEGPADRAGHSMAYAVTDPAEAARRAVAGHFAARLRGAADPVPVLIDWAGALAARAGDLAGAAARHLLAEADVKLAAAGAVAPLPADGLIVWAEVTAALARRAETPAEADRLWRLAAERFSEAARRQPGRGDALVAWAGRLVARAAAAGDPEEAAPLHAEADDVFAQALRVAPGDYDALCDRAAALIAWAAITDDLDESDALLDRAETVCRAALTIAPTETYTLACIAALRGRTEDCREALEAAALAATLPPPEHLAGDEDLAAVRGEPWFRALLGPRPTAGAH